MKKLSAQLFLCNKSSELKNKRIRDTGKRSRAIEIYLSMSSCAFSFIFFSLYILFLFYCFKLVKASFRLFIIIFIMMIKKITSNNRGSELERLLISKILSFFLSSSFNCEAKQKLKKNLK